jgi:two-component system, response regulator, stage 0 sporulation protein F
MSKILLVEDDANQALLYQAELEAEGYEIALATNGHEAVELVKSANPDLVVMDISMPGMDGIEAMGRILSEHNKLPVILNTAYASYKDNFLSWSADAYVIKQSDLAELKATIKKLLEKKSDNA